MRLPILNFVVFALLLFSVNCFCQDENGNSGDSEIKTQNHSNGIQFYLVNGLSVSYKKLISDNKALRFHLDLSGSFFDSNREHDWYHKSSYDTSESSMEINSERNRQNIALSFQFHYSPYNNDYINTYIGFGPWVGYSRTKYDSESERSYDDRISKSINDQFSEWFKLGILGILGTEGFVSDHISIFAEYQFMFSRIWYKSKSDYEYIYPESENNSKNEHDSSSNFWDFTLSNVKLGVSIYF